MRIWKGTRFASNRIEKQLGGKRRRVGCGATIEPA
jgi:hypothetical protein